MASKYLPKAVKVVSKKIESSDTFTIVLDWKIKHDPGQFIQISIPGVGEAPISIASYSNKHVQLTIRKIGNVTNNLFKLEKGDKVFVRGPYGKGYPLEEVKGKDVIFIGGGCGVAPLKGGIEYLEKNRKSFGDVYLFVGYRSPDDILFLDKHEQWKEKFNFFESVDKLPEESCYNGDVGFITNLVEKQKITANNKVVFLCGPTIMMEKTIEILNQKGFKNNQIYISAERLMYCAFGLCCHCMIHGDLTCMDGPVFRYDKIKNIQ